MRIISVIISALLPLGVFSACKGKDVLKSESAIATNEVELEDEYFYDGDSNEADTQYGEWEKSYFNDEFGEPDYANPFISLFVRERSNDIDLGVSYRPSGTFSFILFEYNGRLVHNIYSSTIVMTIRVNGQDIGPVSIPVEKNEFFISGIDSQIISTIFNQGSFSISLRDKGYLDDYHYIFHINEPKGCFEQAVTHLLNSEYYGE
ncbi:MAG: hypothetical protein HDS04_06115 [Bacteroides sp.]|nr:hypothetical protein [Bacteroides sp.]MBD5327784.1 hypothetical protein [Bacteroides sp.]